MTAEPLDLDEFDREDDDFLAFWEERRAAVARATVKILGVEVDVPDDLPLEFEDTATALQTSEKREDFERLLVILFGEGTFEQWKDKGLTVQQLKVIVAWGMANASGKPTTFAQAADLIDAAEAAKAAGKAPTPLNRAARRAPSRTAASGGTGRSSKRTSRASTA